MTSIRKSALGRILTPLALVAITGLGMTAAASPAAAQKKKDQDKAPKANYSKEFVAAYKPIETAANAATPDYAAIKPQLPAMLAAATTPDDKMVAGRMAYSVGTKSQDNALAMQGIEMMLASGRADAELTGQLNFAAGQMSYNLKDFAKARTYAQTAVDAGYTDNDAQMFVTEAYFAGGQYAEGLKYLSDAITARKAAGQPVNEAWVKRALATAYNNKLNDDARRWALLYAREFPGATSWGDAVAIALNTGNYAPAETLDLLRLARRTDTLRTKAMYLEYIDAADPRKLPNEVIQVLDAGSNAKLLDASTQIVKDARATASARIAADKTELPSLQRDAGAASAKLVTVMAAADTLLSYGKGADAATMYEKALGMPGANKDLVLTRLGIAQIDQGKFADAQATLGKVTGTRQPIAALWSLYAAQKAVPAPIPAPAATTS